ncbi:glycosyltransferase family 2 protein [Mucilaginibacter sp.]|uniref:glycosyltransferase family 2 protein n=1 Tax=Mucilaginibacter sp. TaxID=1882438 RepID=UPI003267B977
MSSRVMIVMPCLNEEKNMAATCHSLGFGLGELSVDRTTILIIVDNNSTDNTGQIARKIQLSSPKDHVFIINENEQGFIPARSAGNLFAASLCEKINVKTEDILILQVDADTIYPNTYVDSMRFAAESYGKNFMVEACVDYTPEFRQNNTRYIDLLEQTDARYQRLYETIHDYVVDDKVVAYWLSDYIIWGGHTREFTLYGDEIFAETTRLFLRGQIKGAAKRNVGSLKAFHSERKVIENPSMHFATAGFPRETAWDNFWIEKKHLINLEDIDETIFNEAIFFRILHLIALFYILPIHVDRTLANGITLIDNELSKYLQDLIPTRSINELQDQPGLFLSDVFTIIDKNPQLMKEKVDDYLKTKT